MSVKWHCGKCESDRITEGIKNSTYYLATKDAFPEHIEGVICLNCTVKEGKPAHMIPVLGEPK